VISLILEKAARLLPLDKGWQLPLLLMLNVVCVLRYILLLLL